MNVRGQGTLYLHHGDGNVMEKRRQIWVLLKYCLGFPGDSMVKNPPANAGYAGSIPGLGRSPGEGNGNPLQYSCLESIMDRGAWWATVHEVAKSRTRLSNTSQSVDQVRDGVGCEHLQSLRARSLKTSSSNVHLGWHVEM